MITQQVGPTYTERAEMLLDKHRSQMVECLAAAICGDRNGRVGFDFHLHNGTPQRMQCSSDFTIAIR